MNRLIPISLALLLAIPGSAMALDLARAKANYDRYCAACHGFNGMSVMPDTPHLRMNQGLLQQDMQLLTKLKQGGMRKPPMQGVLSDQDLLDVITYTRQLR